jgi:PAS domain S-box-containing protein
VLLRQIASNIDAMLWSWDPRDGRITYTNPAFEAFWGMSADTLADTPWQWLEQVEPADRERVLSCRPALSNAAKNTRSTGPRAAWPG